MRVLVTSESKDDHRRICEILDGAGWIVCWARTAQDTVQQNLKGLFEVVLCDSNLCDAAWQDLLHTLNEFDKPPLVVVTSSAPDHPLWAEAINLGAHDVLAKPFCTEEVRWVFDGLATSSRRRRETRRRHEERGYQ